MKWINKTYKTIKEVIKNKDMKANKTGQFDTKLKKL